jgi:hypothetical protein
MYIYYLTFHTCQVTSVRLQSAIVRILCLIPCEFALMHFCLLFLFRFSYFDISVFILFYFFRAYWTMMTMNRVWLALVLVVSHTVQLVLVLKPSC